MNGKGSKQRPTNHDAYASSYETIFGKKARVTLEVKASEGTKIQGKEYDLMTFDECVEMENPCKSILDFDPYPPHDVSVWPFPVNSKP